MSFEIENGILSGPNLKFYGDLVIPDGVREIAPHAFLNNPGIKSVVFPSSVERIGAEAFSNCYNLVKAVIPENAKIGDGAFYCCGFLITNLSIRQWNKKYGRDKLNYAMAYIYYYQSGDPFFDSVKEDNNKFIKRNLTDLIDRASEDNTLFVNYVTREITLDLDQVEELLDKFSGNVEAAAVLLDYRKNNFSDEFLEEYTTEQNEKELGLRKRTVADWRKIFDLGSDKQGGYIIKKYRGKDTDIIIPDTIGRRRVTEIGAKAFSPEIDDGETVIKNIKNIRSVYIPESITKIGEEAFHGCLSLENIEIPSSVISIGNIAFYYCEKLSSVTIPDGVKHIGYSAFAGCSAITEITLPGTLREIGVSVFADCENLTKAVIEKGITAIPGAFFLRCRKLAEVQLPDGITVLGNNVFSECEKLKHITLPDSVSNISTAFMDCPGIEELIIPAGVKTIYPDAFHRTSSLRKITLPDTITEIGERAFEHSCITSIKIPSGVKTIPENTFRSCSHLEDVEIPASVTEIDQGAFYLASRNLVISAPRGSYAIEYAKEQGIKFKELPI